MYILIVDEDSYIRGNTVEEVINELEGDWQLPYSVGYKIYEAKEIEVKRKFEIVKEKQ